MLGDSVGRDYAKKLSAFEEFARPELARVVSDLRIEAGSAVLDLGCGVGTGTRLLASSSRLVVGVDLSSAHAHAAARSAFDVQILVANARLLPFADRSFDLLWACNSLGHLPDPASVLRDLARYLRPDGRVAITQSHLVPEMFFAWDYHFDARVRYACHAYYRAKYGLTESDTASSTRLLGTVREAGFLDATPRTYCIERHAPLDDVDHRYLMDVFRGYWGEKLRPFLVEDDWLRLQELCDPESPQFCLGRNDFHHLQTITVVVARRPTP